MRRRGTFRFLTIVVIALVGSGCTFFEILVRGSPPDLTIVSVEPIKDGVKAVGVRVVFQNLGDTDAHDVEYSLMLSSDTAMSTAQDWVIYRGSVTVPAGMQIKRDLDEDADIGPYIENNYLSPPEDGQYYVGAVVDPVDKLVEDNELNNAVASSGSSWYIQGHSYRYAVKLRVWMPSGLTYYDPSGSNVPVPGGQTRLVVSAIPSGESPQVTTDAQGLASFPENVDLSSIANAFHCTVDLTYNDASGVWSPYFHVGIDVADDYVFYLILDSDNDGSIWMSFPSTGGPPLYLDPWQTYPTDAFSAGTSYYVSGDGEVNDVLNLNNGDAPY